jgi:3,4-dihydroxy-2-butanone 4-phosphate synthase
MIDLSPSSPFSHPPDTAADRVAQALAALRRGCPVLVQDDAERENEADLVASAELVDLMKLAGLQAAAVLCELMNADGSMARGAQVSAYARQFDLELLSVDDVVQVRMAMAAEAATA